MNRQEVGHALDRPVKSGVLSQLSSYVEEYDYALNDSSVFVCVLQLNGCMGVYAYRK